MTIVSTPAEIADGPARKFTAKESPQTMMNLTDVSISCVASTAAHRI